MDYLLEAVREAAKTTCHSRPVGCVVVKDDKIIGRGHNGVQASFKWDRCERIEKGVPSGEGLHLCPCAHAEPKAFADLNIEQASGSTVYLTTTPCNNCMDLLIDKRVNKIVYLTYYSQPLAEQIANSAEIILIKGTSHDAINEYQNLVGSKAGSKSRAEEIFKTREV